MAVRKGIILAGGSGTRLHPTTLGVCKQLLPIYDKPMIYYPLSTLMLAGIRELLIITTRDGKPQFENLLGDGSAWGIDISYAHQDRPDGVAQALIIAQPFIGADPCALILGDNLFFGGGLVALLRAAAARHDGATMFSYPVTNPQDFGVVEMGPDQEILSIEEKPNRPKSRHAITGLYFFDSNAPAYAKEVGRSARCELEITDVLKRYHADQALNMEVMTRGMAWLDAGTHESLLDAAHFIQTLEHRQGLKVGCPEEIAWRQGWISDDDLYSLGSVLLASGYGKYLQDLLLLD